MADPQLAGPVATGDGEATAAPASNASVGSANAELRPEPHCPQKRVLSGLMALHFGHTMAAASRGSYAEVEYLFIIFHPGT